MPSDTARQQHSLYAPPFAPVFTDLPVKDLPPALQTPSESSGHTTPLLRPGPTAKRRQAFDDDPSPTEQDVLIKRQRNNIAAKKYRQKKIDRIKELEDEVDDIKRERDELRIRLARQEAETAALREMLKLATASHPARKAAS